MENEKYFNEYLKAKLVLNKLVCQFYDYNITQEEAEKLGINYTDNNIFNSLNNVACVFHNYSPEGLYLWKKLGIHKPIILVTDMWKLQSLCERYDENKDYHRGFLELKLIDLYIVEKYYEFTISKKDAVKLGIEYEETDDYDGNIHGCDHLCESAGEHAWTLFGFEYSFVPSNKFHKLRKDLVNELLEIDSVKQKVLKKTKNI